MKYYIFLILIFSFSSCEKNIYQNENSTVELGEVLGAARILWNTQLTDGTGYAYGRAGLHHNNEKVVFVGVENGGQTIQTLNIENGEVLSSWSRSTNTSTLNNYSYKGNFLITDAQNLISFNIEKGEPDYNLMSGRWFASNNYGLGNLGFVSEYSENDFGGFHSCLYQIDLEKQNAPEYVVCPNYFFEFSLATGYMGSINTIDVFLEQGDTMMFIGCNEVDSMGNDQPFWSLYNKSQKEWEIEKVMIEAETKLALLSFNSFYHNDLFYFASFNNIQCWDRFTGELIWKKSFPNGFNSSSIELIPEHNVIVGCNNVENTYCLDMDTGNTIWVNDATSSASRVHYQDDVIYIAGGSSGKFHAIDVVTGEDIWAIKSPDTKHDSQAYFSRQINGIPAKDGEKGKIFVSSYLTAYCYEAVN